jgi:O-antigen/teichoic acid export membrane protein
VADGARTAAGKLARYGIAGVGPLASAGVQFVQSLALLRVLSPGDFGRFTFLLIVAQFSWGLWSALFCAPLPTLLAAAPADRREGILRCLFSTNLVVAGGAALLFVALGRAVGLGWPEALLYGGFAATALIRWFGRSYAYVDARPVRTMASDLTYSGVLLLAVGAVLFSRGESLLLTYAALFASAVLGLLPFGGDYLRRQFVDFDLAAVRGYQEVFRRHSGWSLVGVVTTEATANAHSYIVTAAMGPGAFAPLAASALMIRPIGVALNALTEFERAQMAREIGAGRLDQADAAVSFFRRVMVLVWLVTAIAAGFVLLRAPHLLFPPRYSIDFLTAAASLWLAVAAIRLVRAPESAFLQAAGAFGTLARTSMISCLVSLVAVPLLLWRFGLLWSIAGIALGEAVYAFWTWRQARAWLATRRAASPSRIVVAES